MAIKIHPLENQYLSKNALDLLLTRRSVKASDIGQPGPNAEELETILTAAARVPDHGKTVPFYFVVFEGKAREQAGKMIAEIYKSDHPEASTEEIEREEKRLSRAPLVIAVIHRHRKAKHPRWEQILSVGAACQNLLLAAKALNYDGQWLTEWYAYNDEFKARLGLDERDEIAGFIHIGRGIEKPEERERPDLKKITTHWSSLETPLHKGDEYDKDKFDLPDLGIRQNRHK